MGVQQNHGAVSGMRILLLKGAAAAGVIAIQAGTVSAAGDRLLPAAAQSVCHLGKHSTAPSCCCSFADPDPCEAHLALLSAASILHLK